MAVTGCSYGVHHFVNTGAMGTGHLHECTECGAVYIRPGAECHECAPTEAIA